MILECKQNYARSCSEDNIFHENVRKKRKFNKENSKHTSNFSTIRSDKSKKTTKKHKNLARIPQATCTKKHKKTNMNEANAKA